MKRDAQLWHEACTWGQRGTLIMDCMTIRAKPFKSKLMIRNTGKWWLRLWVCSREVQRVLDHGEQIAVDFV